MVITKLLKSYQTNQRVQVELLPDFVYCLLPSVSPDSGFWGKYDCKPDFIKDLHFVMDLGKVYLWFYLKGVISKFCVQVDVEVPEPEKTYPSKGGNKVVILN